MEQWYTQLGTTGDATQQRAMQNAYEPRVQSSPLNQVVDRLSREAEMLAVSVSQLVDRLVILMGPSSPVEKSAEAQRVVPGSSNFIAALTVHTDKLADIRGMLQDALDRLEL